MPTLDTIVQSVSQMNAQQMPNTNNSLLATWLKVDVTKAVTIPLIKFFMLTDSTTGLQWLCSLDKQPIFVANRVSEILEPTTVDQWFHLSSADSPADAMPSHVS